LKENCGESPHSASFSLKRLEEYRVREVYIQVWVREGELIYG
jgi:hypothetical protein